MKKIQNIFWISVPFLIIGYLVYEIAVNSFTDHFLGSNPQFTKAIIINKKNFITNHPVKPRFTYSYAFYVNGEQYTGNSHNTLAMIGDTIEIEYNKEHPFINKALKSNE